MTMEPGERYCPEPNALERRAAAFLGRLARREAPGEAARPALRRATGWAVGLAIAAGVVSGGLIGGSEIWARETFGLEDRDFWDALPFWIGWFAAAGVVSAVEIAFLYWVALTGIGRVLAIARVDLGEDGYPGLLARGFARGALEFPNPRGTIWGVDPYAYVPGWQLVLRTVVYKLKVGVTSFVLRVFLRRVAARIAVRGLVPLMAGPLYAAWNAIIVWRIMTEARIRAYGPAAVEAMLEAGFEDLGEDARRVVLHGVGEMTRRAADMHPNLVYLLGRLRDRLGIEAEEVEVDWERHRGTLERLGPEEQRPILALLTLTAVIGSRSSRRQRALVDEAHAACGLSRPRGLFRTLSRRLRDGRLDVPEGLDAAMEGGTREAA